MLFPTCAVSLFSMFLSTSALVANSTSSSATSKSTKSSSSSSASASTSTFPTTKNTTSKRGIAYTTSNNPGDVRNFNQSTSEITWLYDWDSSPPDYISEAEDGIEFVPMQWGSGNIENFESIVAAEGAKTILAFNEPDYNAESNIDPTTAAELWMQYIQPLKASGVRLGGPAITSNGQYWLQQFFAACTNCTIDFLPLHWYGEGAANFYNYIWTIHAAYPNTPIWITEYADTAPALSDVSLFLDQTTSYMDSLDWIERYAWFGFFRPETGANYNFLNDDGSLNTLGEAYIGAASVVATGEAVVTTTQVGAPSGASSLITVSVATNNHAPTLIAGSNGVVSAFSQQSKQGIWNLCFCLGTMIAGMVLL